MNSLSKYLNTLLSYDIVHSSEEDVTLTPFVNGKYLSQVSDISQIVTT